MIFCMSVAAPSPGDGAVLNYLPVSPPGEQDALADLYKTRHRLRFFAPVHLENEHDAEDVLRRLTCRSGRRRASGPGQTRGMDPHRTHQSGSEPPAPASRTEPLTCGGLAGPLRRPGNRPATKTAWPSPPLLAALGGHQAPDRGAPALSASSTGRSRR